VVDMVKDYMSLVEEGADSLRTTLSEITKQKASL
jgi:hypothetical protein